MGLDGDDSFSLVVKGKDATGAITGGKDLVGVGTLEGVTSTMSVLLTTMHLKATNASMFRSVGSEGMLIKCGGMKMC